MKDIYFDDQYWTVRYLLVDTRKWLPGKKVLLSPMGFDQVDILNGTVNVFASKEMVKNVPHQREDKPVSKQAEIDLAMYYGWPSYWSGLGPWAGYGDPFELADAHHNGLLQDGETTNNSKDHHLRSVNEIKGNFSGYRIEALDGEIGHVSDFVIDTSNWRLTYLVVETRNLLIGHFALLAINWINNFDWAEKKVFVDLTKEQVKQGANFDPNIPITRDYEEHLYNTFNKPKYWE